MLLSGRLVSVVISGGVETWLESAVKIRDYNAVGSLIKSVMDPWNLA